MKGSDLKRKIKETLIDIFYKLNIEKTYKIGEKILVTTTDGIGDFIVREKVFIEIIEKYGKENIVVLTKDKTVPIIQKYGITNIVIFDDKSRKKLCGGIELLKKLFSLEISKIYSLEFSKHDLWFVKYFSKLNTEKKFEIIGYKNSSDNLIEKNLDKYYTKLVSKESTNQVIELSIKYLQEIFNKKLNIEEAKPNLSILYKKNREYENVIAIGIGSIDRKKIMSPKNLEKIIIKLSETYQEYEIILLGKGELEKKIIAEMIEILKYKNVIDKVNKTSLEETNIIINSCKLYIGVDSGLYNIAFGLNKKIIGLFTKKDHAFSHNCYSDITILSGENGESGYFGNEYLNGISPQQVIEASEKLLGE
ncbi:MAG: glycosyltransferase family 9 protein [Fusobacteriaceae bacterium]